MSVSNLKTLLFTSEEGDLTAQAFLFQMARHFSSNGQRVLYVANEPISALPATINDSDVVTDPDIMRLIQFMYAPDGNSLQECLGSLTKNSKPATAIIIQNLEKYCTEDTATTFCNKLVKFGEMNQARLQSQTTLVASHQTPVPAVIIRKYFQNIWSIDQKEDNMVVLESVNPIIGHPAVFHFSTHDNSSRILIEKVFEATASKIS